jgi:hypothetical protein
MRISLKPALSLLAALWLCSAAANAPDPAAELLRLSGVESQMQTVRPQILDGLKSAEFDLAADDVDRLERVINAQFADEALREQSLEILRERWDEKHSRVALAWLNGELGRRITELEEYASTPEGAEEMQGFAAELQAAPPRPGRVELLDRLNQAFDGTRLAVDTTLAMAFAVAVAANAANPADEQLDGPTLRERVEAGRGLMTQQMQRVLVVYYLFTYHELLDEEIAAYADFLESEAGGWYVNALTAAYLQPVMTRSLGLSAAIDENAGNLPN